MATSGTYTYVVNKQKLIKNALIEAGIIEDTQEVEGTMYAWMSDMLNRLVKQLQSKGLLLWKIKELTLLLEEGKVEYTLSTTGDRCSETVVRTVTTADVAIAGTTYTVSSTSGMTVGNTVGIEMDDGEMHWDTIATIPDSTSLTVSTGPTVACASGAVVYAATAKVPKPLRIQEAYTIQAGSEGSHQPLNIIPREEYMRLNDKTSEGAVVNLYYNPERTTGQLKVWPTSNDNIQRIVMTAEMPLDDMTSEDDDLAFPDYWFEAIHTTMSYRAARSYNAPAEKQRTLRADSKEATQEAEDFDVETTYIEMVPEVVWIN